MKGGKQVQITDFHAKYIALTLSKSSSGGSFEKLAATLSDAQVDLNPHQIEAALFAFKSPFGKGIIMGDETGLGKTISSSIVAAQKWAEHKRKILVLIPARLKIQWQLELTEKFYLPATIIDTDKFKEYTKAGIKNPFNQDSIVIVSYNFGYKHSELLKAVKWDLVIIDEAHNLRNAYKTENIIGRTLLNALDGCFKLLLTATPLNNSLLELYGLSRFIDNYIFGDLDSFKLQFSFLRDEQQYVFDDLVARVRTFCIRTLRRQVTEYIQYTERRLITQEFTPTAAEQDFYDKFSNYLRRDNLWAIPNSGRSLISMVLWKLLASSTYAIAGTLEKLIARLEYMYEHGETVRNVKLNNLDEGVALDNEEEMPTVKKKKLTQKELVSLKKEIDELREYHDLAVSIKKNAKGEALLLALQKGFSKLKELGAPQKAVIFTESLRTQEYIFTILQESKHKNKTVLYHGGLTTKKSEAIIQEFKDKMQIMVATESAAEGLNLQFAAMIINFDLPFNPQRIEQRIGRCHRYGQKNDVVVINFLNQNNIADQRVYELLCNKFQLFEGVFGASDGVLGSVDALDFEKRIVDIYQTCRTADEIERSFNELRKSLEPQIDEQMSNIKKKLLENFDDVVDERLKINYNNSTTYLNRYETMLWELTKHFLQGWADFSDETEEKAFTLNGNPFGQWYSAQKQTYIFDKAVTKGQRYRLNSPLAKKMVEWIAEGVLDNAIHGEHYLDGEITFDVTNHPLKITDLINLKGKTGYLMFNKLTINGLENEDILIFTGYISVSRQPKSDCPAKDDEIIIDGEILKRLFELSALTSSQNVIGNRNRGFGRENKVVLDEHYDKLYSMYEKEKQQRLNEIAIRNSSYFDDEIEKLDKWANDIKQSLEKSIKNLDTEITELKKSVRKIIKLPEKLEMQKQINELETKRNTQRFDLFTEQDKIDKQKEELITNTQKRLEQSVSEQLVFVIKWEVV